MCYSGKAAVRSGKGVSSPRTEVLTQLAFILASLVKHLGYAVCGGTCCIFELANSSFVTELWAYIEPVMTSN